MLSNMKIGTKLFAGFFFMIFLLLIVTGAGYLGLSWLGTAITGLGRDSNVSNLMAEVADAAELAEGSTFKYMLYSNDEDFANV